MSNALALGRDRLAGEAASREARLLLALSAGVPVEKLAVLEPSTLTEAVLARYQGFLERRAAGEPISHIRGSRAFWKHEFVVSSAVLDPRPETETLVDAALQDPFERVLDLGTGSGCILLSLLAERPNATGLGVDVSDAALGVAAQNRERLGLAARAELQQSDWFSGVTQGPFDLIVSNPPYIAAHVYETLEPSVREFEPRLALTPGPQGTEPYALIAAQAPRFLRPGGRVLVEIGYDQGRDVSALFQNAGFQSVEVRADLDGRDRVVIARQPK